MQTISIIICTYNRANILADTLDSYNVLHRTGSYEIELLIIDNNSSDDTLSIINKFKKKYPELRYVFEPRPGLSYARNTGIKESASDIIAFVDDDVHFDPLWLKELIKIFEDYPEASCIGGKSIPQFQTERADWIIDDLLSIYGSTNSGDKIKWMTYPEHPFGLNMAFRREVFVQVGMFDPSLGRKKKNLLSNEESELFWRISKANLKVIYTPKAIIYHQIPPERSRQEWVLNRYYWQGISSVAFDQLVSPHTKLDLIKNITSNFFELIYQASGKHWSPRKAYWHYKAIKFNDKLSLFFKIGKLKQMCIEVLSF